jgi:hypothetical protein
VLPLSNLAGYLPPFWLAPQLAMRRAWPATAMPVSGHR